MTRPRRPRTAAAPTLAHRLTRTLLVCVGAVWLASIAGVVAYVHREINLNFDNELHEISLRLLDVAVHNLDVAGVPPPGAPPVQEPPPLASRESLNYRLIHAETGQVLMVPAGGMKAGAFYARVPTQPGFFNAEGWRVSTVVHPTRPFVLQLADPRADRRHAVQRVLWGLTLPTLGVLAVLAVLLSAVARSQLGVLHRLETEISARGEEDLRPLPLAGMPRELQSVGDHVNRLLQRLGHALDVERALSANAAHELRTPLAAVRLRLQTALEGPLAPSEVQAALTALDVLSHRTEKLLQLSRAESAAALTHVPVDVMRLVATVAQEFWQTPALQQRLALIVPDTAPAATLGDVDALAIAVRNLVENALRYSDGRVELRVHAPCMVVVRDHGPGVPPERLSALLRRHVRDSDSRTGYGLGLSIVTSIVERHHGELELVSPLPDGSHGFEARLRLPTA